MAWIEPRRKGFVVMVSVNGEPKYVWYTRDRKAAIIMRDEINDKNKVEAARRGIQKMRGLYKEAK